MTISRFDLRPAGIESTFGMSFIVGIFAWGALVMPFPAWGGSDGDAKGPMIKMNAGSFRQGSVEEEADRRANEGPVREVVLPTFLISKSEVTVAQFRIFVEKTGYLTDAERNVPVGDRPAEGCFTHRTLGEVSPGWVEGRSWRDPGFAQEPSHPVVCVSWNDATAYTQWLRDETGLDYRLPSESEFEYVLRQGLSNGMGWQAANEFCENANLGDQSLKDTFPDWGDETLSCTDGYALTAPVESYGANSLGLYDVGGNVAEWVRDCWHESYVGAPSDGSAWVPSDTSECQGRVLRGGDFVSSESNLRPAHRAWVPDAFRTYHVGFRVARDR